MKIRYKNYLLRIASLLLGLVIGFDLFAAYEVYEGWKDIPELLNKARRLYILLCGLIAWLRRIKMKKSVNSNKAP